MKWNILPKICQLFDASMVMISKGLNWIIIFFKPTTHDNCIATKGAKLLLFIERDNADIYCWCSAVIRWIDGGHFDDLTREQNIKNLRDKDSKGLLMVWNRDSKWVLTKQIIAEVIWFRTVRACSHSLLIGEYLEYFRPSLIVTTSRRLKISPLELEMELMSEQPIAFFGFISVDRYTRYQ